MPNVKYRLHKQVRSSIRTQSQMICEWGAEYFTPEQEDQILAFFNKAPKVKFSNNNGAIYNASVSRDWRHIYNVFDGLVTETKQNRIGFYDHTTDIDPIVYALCDFLNGTSRNERVHL